jgi:uncharacterized repeat protein (TIGR01451 family)
MSIALSRSTPTANVSNTFSAFTSNSPRRSCPPLRARASAARQIKFPPRAAKAVTTRPVCHRKLPRASDKLTYKLTFFNIGRAPAKNLEVAMLIPSYVHGSLTFPAKTVKGSKTVMLTSGNTSQLVVGQSIEANPDLPSGTVIVAAIIDGTQFNISGAATATDRTTSFSTMAAINNS